MPSPSRVRSLGPGLAALASIVLLGPAAPVRAQKWTWPEHSKNLKVLPADTGPEKLSAIMRGFTRSLGVRCQYCHVGGEGKPLSSFDFASDANPNKDRARRMYTMLGTINAQLKEFPRSGQKVNMWCHTCHAGRPKPMTLAEELDEAYAKGGAASAVSRYRGLREKYYGGAGYDFSERSLGEFGGDLIEKGDHDGAIAVLRLDVETSPHSGDAWERLGDAYSAAGQRSLAAISYRKSLELEADNDEAVEKLRKTEAELASGAP